jgi:hypothetical protein
MLGKLTGFGRRSVGKTGNYIFSMQQTGPGARMICAALNPHLQNATR